MRASFRRLLALSLLLPLVHVGCAAEEKPVPLTTVVDLPSPAGPRALGASLTTAPDGTLWLSWVEAAAENLAAAAAKSPGPHHHPAAAPASAPPATTPSTAPNTLRFATFDAAAKKWSAARTIATRADLPLSSADFPQLVLDGRGTTAERHRQNTVEHERNGDAAIRHAPAVTGDPRAVGRHEPQTQALG